jgi:hypothetical protein
MTVPVKIDGRTFHLRASMSALRAAKTDGVELHTLEQDPLGVVVLAYHFACAGALTQGNELKLTCSEFEDLVTAADLENITNAMGTLMQAGGKKK